MWVVVWRKGDGRPCRNTCTRGPVSKDEGGRGVGSEIQWLLVTDFMGDPEEDLGHHYDANPNNFGSEEVNT